MCANHASSDCECCAADAVHKPIGIRDDQRHAALAAEHVAILRRLVDELVHRAQREIDDAHFDDRAQARERHAHGGAHDRRLGDRRVDHALGAELLLQPAVLREDAAASEVLAQRHHVRIGAHRLGERGGGRLRIVHHRHWPAPVFWTSVYAVAGSGERRGGGQRHARRRSRPWPRRRSRRCRPRRRRARRACRARASADRTPSAARHFARRRGTRRDRPTRGP